ncbi:MAG: hypothetical protein K2X47_14215, partial [Bdellovibrionales bacterium]|nr:hypothetical protein [Bdellovibrionales bacterium]
MKTSLLILAILAGSNAMAASKQQFCQTELKSLNTCKNIPQNRREELGRHIEGGNPVAITNEGGDLKVWYTTAQGSLQGCQVTNSVEKFRMSGNPGDRSTAYFTRNGSLMDVKMTGAVAKNVCPKASKQDFNQSLRIPADTIDFTVNSNSNSRVTMTGYTSSGWVIISTD